MTSKQRREEIKRLLSRLEPYNQFVFILMYSPKELGKDINLVVDEMPAKKLKWALQQCQNSYHRIFRLLKM
jgi:hypothetical protein